MDKQVQKLKKLIDEYLGLSREDIFKEWGLPLKSSDDEIWFYIRYRWPVFRDKTGFIFVEDEVVDIVITSYILWKEYKNVFFYEGEPPEYKVIKL